MRSTWLFALLTTASLLATAGCGQMGPANNVQPLDEKATAVRLQATVYELRIPPEKIGELDAARLAKVDLANPPPEFGSSRALYVIDQKVSLAGDRVTVGTQEPMVTNTRMTDKGQRINTVQYSSVGAIVDFKAERAGPRLLQVNANIEVSAKTESGVEISPGVNSSVIRRATLSLKGPAELAKPTVLLSGDASSRDKDGKAVVYLARVVLTAGT